MPPTIRSELDVLLDKVQDVSLRTALQAHIDRLRQRRSFGLVFEQHIPERVRLPQHPIRVGSQVVSRDDDDSPTWEVVAIEDGAASLIPIRDRGGAYLPRGEHGEPERTQARVDALVVISDFGEPVLPGFRFLGSVDRGGDKPYHVVINGENHHALEALRFTHAGKVDCIYIDPPYNSGARDWKYNNDYVDENDGYRHSKWLAFMERRLKLAKELLKPEKSVMIVTIDEHELQRLRMLLDQTFPGAYIQVVTIVVNPKGVAQGRFARVEEYAIYCFFGMAGVIPTDDDYLSDSATLRNTRFWKGLLRAGTNARPSDGLGMAYPIHIDVEHSRVASVGRTMRQRIEAGEVVGNPDEWLPPADEATPHGTVAVWPLRADGRLGVWQAVPETLLGLVAEGLVRCALRPEGWALSYVPSGIRAKIENGEIAVTGRDESGSVLLVRKRDLTRAKTVWKRARHDAGWHGSVVLRDLLGQRMFDFPKPESTVPPR